MCVCVCVCVCVRVCLLGKTDVMLSYSTSLLVMGEISVLHILHTNSCFSLNIDCRWEKLPQLAQDIRFHCAHDQYVMISNSPLYIKHYNSSVA